MQRFSISSSTSLAACWFPLVGMLGMTALCVGVGGLDDFWAITIEVGRRRGLGGRWRMQAWRVPLGG